MKKAKLKTRKKKSKQVRQNMKKLSSETKANIAELRKVQRDHQSAMRELRREHRLELKEKRQQQRAAMRELSKKQSAAIKEITSKIRAYNSRNFNKMSRSVTRLIDWRNIGKKPDHKKLAKHGYFVSDLHMHSIHSDGVMSTQMMLDRAKKLKLNISVTDHDTIKGSLEALNNRGNVNVLPGIEVTAKEGKHFLFYFLDENEMKRFYKNEIRGRLYRPTSELINTKKNYDSTLVWAHPKGIYPWQNHKRDFHVKHVDGFEAYNSWGLSKNIKEVYRWAKRDNRFAIGSSDAHMDNEIGNVVTFAKVRSFKTFFNALRKKQAKIVGRDAHYFKNTVKYGLKYVFVRPTLLQESKKC